LQISITPVRSILLLGGLHPSFQQSPPLFGTSNRVEVHPDCKLHFEILLYERANTPIKTVKDVLVVVVVVVVIFQYESFEPALFEKPV
jgi:hypothetical protein